MCYKNFQELLKKAEERQTRSTVAVAAAHDVHALEAVAQAAVKGGLEYRLVGNRSQIETIADEIGFPVEGERIEQVEGDEACARRAVELAREGEADLIMKGSLQTATLLREVVDREHGIRTGGIMSHLAIFELPSYHKLLAATDGGMVPEPNFEEKLAILQNAVEFLHRLGYDCPKVAAMAAAETENPKIRASAEAAEIARMNRAGKITGCQVAGPISLDLALSSEAARIKGYDDPVAGDADLLLGHDMTSGNILGKAFLQTGGAVMAGCILGASVPIVLTSRGASAEEKLFSLLLVGALR